MPDQQKYIYEETYQIVILPDFLTIAYPGSELPEKVGFICIRLRFCIRDPTSNFDQAT